MPSCIICLLDIVDGIDEKEECPNGHPMHMECLREWLAHSKECPKCSIKIPMNIISKHKSFLDQKKKEEEQALKTKQQRETAKILEKIAEKMVFLKFTEGIEALIEKKELNAALDSIEAYDDSHQLDDYKGQDLMYLRGKISYLMGKYDQAINVLFKLVKVRPEYPDAFLFLGKSYEELGLEDKAQWAYDRI